MLNGSRTCVGKTSLGNRMPRERWWRDLADRRTSKAEF